MAYPGYRYGILRTSFPELQSTHLSYLPEEMRLLGGSYNQSQHIAKYPNGSIGFYYQAQTDEQVNNVLGSEMYMVVFDEAPTFRWDLLVKIASSVRVPAGKGLVPMKRYLGNPIGPCIDDLWKYFIEKEVDPLQDPGYRPDEWRAIQIDLNDNPHLDVEAYKRQLSAGLPEHIRKAWLDGEKFDYGQLFEVVKFAKDTQGELIRNERDQAIPYHVLPEMPRLSGTPIIRWDETVDEGRGAWTHPSWIRIYRSYDHGYWPDPAVCLWFFIAGRQAVCFKEKVWYRTIAKDIAQDIVKESKGMRVVTTYCDPDIDIQRGADVVTIRDTFENNGVPMDPSVNDREMYAFAINSALKTEVSPHVPQFAMVQGGCPYLLKYLPQMRYDEKRPKAMADHKHDHAPVALAYFLMSQMPVTKEEPLITVPRWMRKQAVKPRPTLGRRNIRG